MASFDRVEAIEDKAKTTSHFNITDVSNPPL